jgi:hypothetical protein
MIILMFIYNLFASGCSCATGSEDERMGIVPKPTSQKSTKGSTTSKK